MADTAKTIVFDYNGKTYTLEFNRSVARMLEQQGFTLKDIDSKPATSVPMLFAGAFKMHHNSLSRKIIDKIYDKMENRGELVTKLIEMYAETVETLFDEPDEDDEGNVSWGASW